jgi:CRP/FNR family cyclic AMP-dependent transcriptional regulator
MSSQRNTINLLDVEPELGEGLNPQERAAAARVLAVPSLVLEPGPWEPERDLGEVYPVVGFLIVDGMVTRDLLFAGRTTTELLGAGDILRVRALAFQRAIAQLPRVDDRMIVLLWALAERWGRVGRDGVRVPVGLPHRTLATLVGARRPSVTTALTGLAREGLVERIEGGWLLHGDPDEVLAQRLLGADKGDVALGSGHC